MSPHSKAAIALLSAGALFAIGFALGSGDRQERAAPKRLSARDGGAPAIDSLRRAQSIPSLREQKGLVTASPAAVSGPQTSAGSATGSGVGGSSGGDRGTTTGSPVAGTAPPPPAEPTPVRRKSTE